MATTEKQPYKLIYPIILEREGGKIITVEEVTLERMKAKHLKLMPPMGEDSKMEPAAMLPIIAALTNLEVDIIEEFDMEDITPIMESISNFLGKDKSPKTGTK
jgi:hypothetical protein